ncbi:MAG: tetratricopeptide repeat protein [Thermodesulfovibrionales bacterium]
MDRAPVGKISYKHTVVYATAVAVFMGLCLFIGTAHTAMPGEADLFEKAYGLYQSGEHGKAAEFFGTFLKEYPDSSVRDSVLFWQAKSFIHLGRLDNAKALLDTLIEQYSQSTFNGFARQELEVLRQTTSSVSATPVIGTGAQTTQQREPDTCSDSLKKAGERCESLKDQLSDSYTRNQFLENELTVATRDKQYLSRVIGELKQSESGAQKSAIELRLLKEENGRLQQELRTLSSRQLSRDITEDTKELSAKLQETERQRILSEKKYTALQKIQVETEKRDADLEIKLRNTEDKKAEIEVQVKKLYEENARAQAMVKERDGLVTGMERLRQENVRLVQEDRSRSALLQQATEAFQKINAEKDLLQRQLVVNQERERGIGQLQSKLKLTELQKAELEVQTRKAIEERTVYEKRLKDKEALIFRLEKARVDNERGSVSPYDAPALKIGGRQYTRFQIIEESIISSRVISSLKTGTVPWRRGNPYEDFAAEQVLYTKAGEGFLRARQADIDNTTQRYRFDDREREYLIKYLTIDEFISRKIREQTVDKAQVRTYYENNKHLYATKKAEKMVTALMLPYASGTQFEGAIRMTEIQADASEGKSLDMLHHAGSDHLILKQLRYYDLPVWIQEKLQDLKAGETSSIISTDDQFIIYQTWHSGNGVKKFEDVEEEIRNSLAASEVLGPWLSKIRKEAEEVR